MVHRVSACGSRPVGVIGRTLKLVNRRQGAARAVVRGIPIDKNLHSTEAMPIPGLGYAVPLRLWGAAGLLRYLMVIRLGRRVPWIKSRA